MNGNGKANKRNMDRILDNEPLLPYAERHVDKAVEVILFGARGDWSGSRIIPSHIYNLQHNRVPRDSRFVLVARRPCDWDEILAGARKANLPEEYLQLFRERAVYVQGDFTDPHIYAQIADEALKFHREHPDGTILCHLSCAESYYPVIMSGIGSAPFQWDWTGTQPMIIAEKPFASDPSAFRRNYEVIERLGIADRVFVHDHQASNGPFISAALHAQLNPFNTAMNNARYTDRVIMQIQEESGVLDSRRVFYNGIFGQLGDFGERIKLPLLAMIPSLPGFIPELIDATWYQSLTACRPVDPEQVKLGQYVGYADKSRDDFEIARKIPTAIFLPVTIGSADWGIPGRYDSPNVILVAQKGAPQTLKRIMWFSYDPPISHGIRCKLPPNVDVINIYPKWYIWEVRNARQTARVRFLPQTELMAMEHPLDIPTNIEALADSFLNWFLGVTAFLISVEMEAQLMRIMTPLIIACNDHRIPVESYEPGQPWPNDKYSPFLTLPMQPKRDQVQEACRKHVAYPY